MTQFCRCLIVDDHPMIRRGVKALLLEEDENCAVAEAASAEAALEAIRREHWDLMILDVALPDKHGLEVLKEARLLRPNLPVLIWSQYPEREFALRTIKAGAAGYLSKDCAPSELLRAIRQITSGHRYITHTMAENIMDFVRDGQPVSPHDRLSDRELEVLRLLGQGKTVSMIADSMALSVKTVSTYRTRILEKLNLHTTADLMRYAIEYRLTT